MSYCILNFKDLRKIISYFLCDNHNFFSDFCIVYQLHRYELYYYILKPTELATFLYEFIGLIAFQL